MQIIKYPSISQFRNVIQTVSHRAQYHSVPLPTLTFNGTVKLHGTNVSVVHDMNTNQIYAQSRETIIDLEEDHYGFATWVNQSNVMRDLFECALKQIPQIDTANTYLVIYGEWCGQGIQKKVAVCNLSRRFVIFDIHLVNFVDVSTPDEKILEANRIYVFNPDELTSTIDLFYENEVNQQSDIFCIQKFENYTVTIDFSNPQMIQNQLIDFTSSVENQCPFGNAFGVQGTGEGIVWKCVSPWVVNDKEIRTVDLIFKVKGEKHSDTKVKTIAAVDIEKINSIQEFVKSVLTDHRLDKMIELMVQAGHEIAPETTSIFLKSVGNDVLKEESDTIEGNGFTRQEVMPVINKVTKTWYFNKMNTI